MSALVWRRTSLAAHHIPKGFSLAPISNYAVWKRGVYSIWNECEAQIKNISNPRYKNIENKAQAEAYANGILQARLRIQDGEEFDVVFVDGTFTSTGFRKTPSVVAGIGVWWGKGDSRNISERCPGSQMSYRADLIAIARVLETAPRHKKTLLIKTDRQYCVQCFQDWIENWIRDGWKTATGEPVKNSEIIRYIDACITVRARNGQKVVFELVNEHDGANALAKQGERMKPLSEPDWDRLRRGLEEPRDDEVV